LSEWGHPNTTSDVANVFVSFLNGKVSHLPWNNSQIAPEANVIISQLKFINAHGFFTINSQPRVNGSPSEHPVHGWGPPGGHVWQKAYVEFFCSREHVESLKKFLPQFPSLQLQAMSRAGDSFATFNSVTAVTWGVFPGTEIKQPTVVDPEVFIIWKDEAFALWSSEWSDIYSHDSPSYRLLEEIASSFYLVNIVDNNFISGEIFHIFQEVIEEDILILNEKSKDLDLKLKELDQEKHRLVEERTLFMEEKEAWIKQHQHQ